MLWFIQLEGSLDILSFRISARIRKLELEHCFNLFLVYLCVCVDVAVCALSSKPEEDGRRSWS